MMKTGINWINAEYEFWKVQGLAVKKRQRWKKASVHRSQAINHRSTACYVQTSKEKEKYFGILRGKALKFLKKLY